MHEWMDTFLKIGSGTGGAMVLGYLRFSRDIAYIKGQLEQLVAHQRACTDLGEKVAALQTEAEHSREAISDLWDNVRSQPARGVPS